LGSVRRAVDDLPHWAKIRLMRRRQLDLLLIGLVFLGPYMLKRWEATLRSDCLVYAAIAKHMYSTGDWVQPEFAGEPYLKKPPLLFWLSAAGMALFGADGFGASVFPLLTSALLALGLYELLSSLGFRREGLWAALLLLLTRGLMRNAALRMEPVVCALTVGAVLAAAKAEKRPVLLLLIGVCAGLGFLTKSAAGLWPLAVGLPAAVLLGPPRAFLRPWLWLGLAAGAVIAAPWHIAMGQRWGERFWLEYLQHEIWLRLDTHSTLFPYRSPVFYVRSFVLNFLPTVVLLPGVLILGLRKRLGIPKRLGWLLALWTLLGAALPLLPRTKYARYLLPLYVPLSVYCGFFTAKVLRRSFDESLKRFLAGALPVLYLLLACLPITLHADDKTKIREVIPVLSYYHKRGYKICFHANKFTREKAALIVYSDMNPCSPAEERLPAKRALLFSRGPIEGCLLLYETPYWKLYRCDGPQAAGKTAQGDRNHARSP